MQGRGQLALVPHTRRSPEHSPRVHFCSHCGAQPDPERVEESNSRVCGSCGFGLLLEASNTTAPAEGCGIPRAGQLNVRVRGFCARPSDLLATRETEAVNRHVTEILVPADAEAQGPANLAVAVTWAARGDDERPDGHGPAHERVRGSTERAHRELRTSAGRAAGLRPPLAPT